MERMKQAHFLQGLLSRQKQPFLGKENLLWRLLGEPSPLRKA